MLAIYTRLSKDDNDSNSIENQLREGRHFAKTNGYRKFEIYNEGKGVSGGNEIEERPQLDRLMKDISAKKIGAVWFRHQNRLERNSVTFHLFSSLAKKMEISVFFGDKKADLNDPTQFLQASIMTAINAYQIEMQKTQIKRTLLDNAKEGKATGGNHIPYGYTTDEHKYLIKDKETSKIVELIFKRCLQGIGGGKIANELNDMKIPTKNGALVWKQPTILNILNNPAYKGQKRFGSGHYPIPVIIEEEIWEKAQKQLKLNYTFKGKRVEHKYLLKHLVFCGKCGKPMHVMNYDKQIRYYRCSSVRDGNNCKNPYIRIDALENLIWGLFEFNTLYEGLESHLTGEMNDEKLESLIVEKESLKKKLNSIKSKLQRTIDLVVEGIVDKKEIEKTRTKVETEKESISTQISNIEDQIISIRDQEALKKSVKRDLGFSDGSVLEELVQFAFDEPNEKEVLEKTEVFKNGLAMIFSKSDRANVLEKTPFNERKELIKKYIKSIKVKGDDGIFLISVEYNLPYGIIILLSKNYTYAEELSTGKLVNFDLLGKDERYKNAGDKAMAKFLLRHT